MFGVAEGNVAVALNPLAGDEAALKLRSAYVHWGAGVGVVAWAADDCSGAWGVGGSNALPGDGSAVSGAFLRGQEDVGAT